MIKPQDLIFPTEGNALTTSGQVDNLPTHPVIAYIQRLPSENSRRGMKVSLQKVAEVYADLFVIRPMINTLIVNGLTADEAISQAYQHAAQIGIIYQPTVKRGKQTGQPKLDKDGQPVYVGNPMTIDWASMTAQTIMKIRTAMIEASVAPRTINHALSAIRGVMDEACDMKMISGDDYRLICKKVKPVKVTTLPKGRDIEPGERVRLWAVKRPQTTNNGSIRDAALLSVLRLGLRVSEVAHLTRADLDTQKRKLFVFGKGRKERFVPINYEALRTIQKWLDIRGNEAGPLFYPVHRSGEVIKTHGLSRQAISEILKKLGSEADIEHFTPHDFRRTLVGDLLSAGKDIVTVQKILGHANPTTTAQYDRRDEELLFDAIDALDNL